MVVGTLQHRCGQQYGGMWTTPVVMKVGKLASPTLYEYTHTQVDAMLTFVKENRNIVSTVIMRCNVLTCVRNFSAPRGTCENNGGIGGKITGELLPACKAVLPTLVELGIRAELWLGEDDSLLSARTLFNHTEETAHALINISQTYPAIVGYNLDLECSGGTPTDADNYKTFLTRVSSLLDTAPSVGPLRFSADVSCSATDSSLDTWCNVLATSGVHRLMNMRTYNAGNFGAWYYSALTPALEKIPLDRLGVGLGCWIDSRTNNTWNITPESASQRICALLNASVQEVDIFLLKQGSSDSKQNFPEQFWVAELQRFMAGGRCDLSPILPPKVSCPTASIGYNFYLCCWNDIDYIDTCCPVRIQNCVCCQCGIPNAWGM
eukprot:m.203377 g.203377  ORF g.203377 m.203377 type:complete len:378 (-) comp18846_c0_seq2:816-1949(-)